METLLLTGGSGRLGSKLITRALGRYRVVSLDRNSPTALRDGVSFRQVDLADPQVLTAIVEEARPSAVVHAAAMTDVDACEADPEQARVANVLVTENVAKAARGVEARLILLSTDYVFSGEAGPYAEEDATGPLSVYGRTKLEAERIGVAACPDACIARTSTLYGSDVDGRPDFAMWLLGELRAGRAVSAVTDQISSPTLVDNLAEMVMAMVEQSATGVFHTVGAEWMSRYEFALRIAGCFDLDPELIVPVESWKLRQVAPRPKHSGLTASRVARVLGARPLTVDEALMRLKGRGGSASL